MRLVHFSDPHCFACPRDWRSLFDKRLFGALNHCLLRRPLIDDSACDHARQCLDALQPDIVLCTGDLTCTGTPEEFALATARLEPLARHGGWEFLYLPGNHDAYVKDPACRAAMAQAQGRLNRRTLPTPEEPVELAFGRLRLLLLDATQSTPPWKSSGTLTPAARQRFREWLAQPRQEREKRISACHFPSLDAAGRQLGWRRRLNGGEEIASALQNGSLDMALCGHIHQPFCRVEASGAMEISAGALSIFKVLNVVDYEEHTGELRQSWFHLNSQRPLLTPLSQPAIAGNNDLALNINACKNSLGR
jgi:3',5'-cyclic AMP phosphodiesterase CpdA